MALSTLGQQWRFMKDLFYYAFLNPFIASVFTIHSFYKLRVRPEYEREEAKAIQIRQSPALKSISNPGSLANHEAEGLHTSTSASAYTSLE